MTEGHLLGNWILFLFAIHIYSLKPTSANDTFATGHHSRAALQVTAGRAVPLTAQFAWRRCWPYVGPRGT